MISALPTSGPEIRPIGQADVGKIGVDITHLAAPAAHDVVVGVVDVGIEPGHARPHVERQDLTQLAQIVQRPPWYTVFSEIVSTSRRAASKTASAEDG